MTSGDPTMLPFALFCDVFYYSGSSKIVESARTLLVSLANVCIRGVKCKSYVNIPLLKRAGASSLIA